MHTCVHSADTRIRHACTLIPTGPRQRQDGCPPGPARCSVADAGPPIGMGETPAFLRDGELPGDHAPGSGAALMPAFLPQVVHAHRPHFLALHCQEFGGKNYEASMSHVDKFVK